MCELVITPWQKGNGVLSVVGRSQGVCTCSNGAECALGRFGMAAVEIMQGSVGGVTGREPEVVPVAWWL